MTPRQGARPFVFARSSVLCALLAVVAGGCARGRSVDAPAGEATPPGAAPAVAVTPAEPEEAVEFQSMEQAEAAFDQARAELAAATVAVIEAADDSVPSAGAAAPARVPPAAPAKGAPARAESRREATSDAAVANQDKKAEAEGSLAAVQAADSRCETACKAWSSLVRAKTAICRLDTPSGARCGRAEAVVRDAEPRVASCSCGS